MKMKHQIHSSVVAILFVVGTPFVRAEHHIQQVLQHADDAVESAGDSQAIKRHAQEALDLVDEAKLANADHSDVVKLINKGEAELSSAVTNAAEFNANTATEDAIDAKQALEAADKVADQEKAGPWPIEQGARP